VNEFDRLIAQEIQRLRDTMRRDAELRRLLNPPESTVVVALQIASAVALLIFLMVVLLVLVRP
jgi:hypothetical protein